MWPFKKKKEKPLKTGCINLFCNHCGSSMDVDLEHIQVYCPFCGAEMFVPVGHYKDLYDHMVKK